MKTGKYSTLILVTIVASTMLFITCKRDNNVDPCSGFPSQTYNYYVSDDNKSKIHYSGTDTLTFVSNAGDTAKLFGQGKQTTMSSFSAHSSSDPGCGNLSYWNFEHITLTYLGTNSELSKLIYKLSYSSVMQSGPNPPTPDPDNTLGLILGSDASTFFSCGYYTSTVNDNANYKDSVYLNGAFIKGILLPCGTLNIFYNYQLGVIQFKDLNQKIWTIKT